MRQSASARAAGASTSQACRARRHHLSEPRKSRRAALAVSVPSANSDLFPCFLRGTVGALLTGVLATAAVNPALGLDSQGQTLGVGLMDGNAHQLVNQVVAVAISWGLAILGSLIVLKIVDVLIGLRVPVEQEVQGLDLSQHGEEGYNLRSRR